jgi:serine/threonine-protein kinase
MLSVVSDPRIGTVLAGSRIESRLRPGGMSEVFVAEHLHLERKVALKLLDPRLAQDQDYRHRFLRESKLAASLYHPNIVPIYDAGEAEGLPYLMMHYVRGSDLAEVLELEAPLDPQRTLTIISQVVSALDAAHERGLVHRDVKPANVLIASGEGAEPAGHVYLTDFGLAKQVQSSSMTRQGMFMGTLDYVAPEQIQGQPVDRRVDVYSLGCVVYECLAGRVPFPKEAEVARMYAHIQEQPPAVSAVRPNLPSAVDAVVATAMAKAPDDRYATAGEFLAALREVLETPAQAAPAVAEAVPASTHEPAPYPSAAGIPIPEPEAAPVAPPLVDVLYMDHPGQRYGLGRTANGYAVWDLRAGGRPIRLFPLTDAAWQVAWATLQELEAAPEMEPPPPGSGEQFVPEPAPAAGPLLVGLVFLDYQGTKYGLGRTSDAYAIWDLEAGGYPVQVFGLDPASWQAAWDRYQELEITPAAAAAGQGDAPWDDAARAGAAPVAAEPAELAGAVAIDYRGAGYGLGRTESAYAIWDLAAGGNPVRAFSLDPASWNEAWSAFQDLESRLGS